MSSGNPSKLGGSLRLQHYLVMAGVAAAVFLAFLRYMPAAGYGLSVAAPALAKGSAVAVVAKGDGGRAVPPPQEETSSSSPVVIINFGDSNSDTGGMAAVNGMNIELPQGRTFFRRPTGRLTDGRLVIDFICESPLSLSLLAQQLFLPVFLCPALAINILATK